MKHKYKLALLEMAEIFGSTSTAKRLKVGALLLKNDSIISMGVNGNPPGWEHEDCEDENGRTHSYVRHAEVAALEKLWHSSETAENSTMFISHEPCLSCAIKIATAGIKEVYYKHSYVGQGSGSGLDFLKSRNILIFKVEN